MKKVLIIDIVHEILIKILKNNNFNIDYLPNISPNEVKKIISDYNGIVIRSKMKLTKDILTKAKNLKFIARLGAGLENIDKQFAEDNGIIVINSPEGNRDAVGEHSIAMLLNLFNKINTANFEVKNGKWKRNENWGEELCGKVIGIIGYGNTGSSFAKKISSFDVKILAYDKYKSGFSNNYVEECNLDKIYENADVVSFNVPLNNETNKMFNKEFVNNFKKDFYLINTSRGKVVDTKSLVEALKSKKILGACLDVLEYEKTSFEEIFVSENNPEMKYLLQSENVIITPHIAGWTKQSFYKISKIAAEKIID